MKKLLPVAMAFGLLIVSICSSGQEFKVSSPDNRITVNVSFGEKILWTARYKGKVILENCPVSMTINKTKQWGIDPKATRKNTRYISREIKPVVATKKAVIIDNFNELSITCRDGYALVFRAYNQGIAYRFETSIEGDIEVNSEEMEMHFRDKVISYFPEEESFISHNERLYIKTALESLSATHFCSLPVFFRNPDNVNILFTEADLYDYPGMFLFGCAGNALKADFPKVVLETTAPERSKDRDEIITKEAGYIASVKGPRSFPWRVFFISDNFADILENDLVYQLSTPLKIDEPGWIKPGKVAWDWWNANNCYGVDFKSGINTQTYKYYIDFASVYGLEYIIL